MTELWAIGLVLFASFIGSFGPILLKKGADKVSFSIKALFNPYIFWGVAIAALGNILFIPSLKGGDLSILYPLVSTIYIWVSIWSYLFLKEDLSKKKILGVLIIIIGVSLVGFGI
tara:strand:- start:254 stop:598 length:345 start_codon:yes stop_codon:yes gene_type:complete